MAGLQLPVDEPVYTRNGNSVVFNQLALKIEIDAVPNTAYYAWLDRMTAEIGGVVQGAEIAEKPTARAAPPLNTAVYYDTPDYQILPTGALLRTSCNKITHAFCAFKRAEDDHHVRRDHRHVFDGDEKRTIQEDPTSDAAVAVVKRLLRRTDIRHPGTFLHEWSGIDPADLTPAIGLDDLRYTFFVWVERRDALRCSIDRARVWNLRVPTNEQPSADFSEVELAVYPRIDPDMARDPRVPELIDVLARSLQDAFGVRVTRDIKYQRAAQVLGIHAGRRDPAPVGSGSPAV